MQFLAVLLVATAIVWLVQRARGERSLRDAMRYGLGLAFVFAGVSHLVMPDAFLVYFPAWVPFTGAIIIISGLVEIAGGLALFGRRYRPEVGLALAVYLLLVFPGNVYAAVSGADATLPGLIDAAWYPWVRLPFQALFIWWALYSTRPNEGWQTAFGRRSRGRLGLPPSTTPTLRTRS
jgi:uncharacterized membrane protein